MIDKIIFYNGPAIGLYECANFRDFMLGQIDIGQAACVSHPFEAGLEERLNNQTYHLHPGVTLNWSKKTDEHCSVSLYGQEQGAS